MPFSKNVKKVEREAGAMLLTLAGEFRVVGERGPWTVGGELYCDLP